MKVNPYDFFAQPYNLHLKIKILGLLPDDTVQFLCLRYKHCWKVYNSEQYWRTQIIQHHPISVLPSQSLSIYEWHKLYRELTYCSDGGCKNKKSNSKPYLDKLDMFNKYVSNDSNYKSLQLEPINVSKYCWQHSYMTCQYFIMRGRHMGRRCGHPSMIYNEQYSNNHGAELFCFSCSKKSFVRNFLNLRYIF
jgi:hypothetical protein